MHLHLKNHCCQRPIFFLVDFIFINWSFGFYYILVISFWNYKYQPKQHKHFSHLFSCSLAFAQPVDSIKPLAEDGEKVIADSLIVTNEEVEEYVPSDKFGNTSIQERLIDNRAVVIKDLMALVISGAFIWFDIQRRRKQSSFKGYHSQILFMESNAIIWFKTIAKVGFDEAVYLYSYNLNIGIHNGDLIL